MQAAIACFGHSGFDVGLREIGAEAGFSAALIVRQFGSKDGLREACDAQVAAQIRRIKAESVTAHTDALITQLAHVEDYADILGYVVQSLLAGGELARQLVEQMVADAVEYIAEGERSGLIRPSRDPVARARYLAYSGLGAMLMQLRFEHTDTTDLSALVRDILNRQLMPSVELYTYGFFTDSSIFDGMVAAGYGAPPEASGTEPNAGHNGHDAASTDAVDTSATATPPPAEGDLQ